LVISNFEPNISYQINVAPLAHKNCSTMVQLFAMTLSTEFVNKGRYHCNGPIPHTINFCFNDWNRKNRMKKRIFHILEEKIMVVNVPTLV